MDNNNNNSSRMDNKMDDGGVTFCADGGRGVRECWMAGTWRTWYGLGLIGTYLPTYQSRNGCGTKGFLGGETRYDTGQKPKIGAPLGIVFCVCVFLLPFREGIVFFFSGQIWSFGIRGAWFNGTGLVWRLWFWFGSVLALVGRG